MLKDKSQWGSVLQFGVKMFNTFQTLPIHAACSAHLILIDLNTLIIFDEI